MVFSGTISRGRFAVAVLLRLALYIAASIAFPFILIAAAPGFGCSPGVPSDACGIVSIIVGMAYKPLVFAIFALSFPGILARRLRDIGVSPWWSVFVLLMLCADYQFLVYAGTSWSFAFTAGVLQISRPDFLFEALALLAVLSIVPGRAGRISWDRLRLPGLASLVLVAIASLLAATRLVWADPELALLMVPLARFLLLPVIVQPYALAVLPFVVGATLWPRQGEVITAAPPKAERPPIPFLRLSLIALLITFVAVVLAAPELRNPLFILVSLVPVFLPTFAVYFGLVLSGYLLIWRRGGAAIAVTLVMVIVLASWGYGHWQAVAAEQADAAEIAAIAKTPLTTHPSVVLVDERNATFRNALLRRSDVDAVVNREYNGVLTEYRWPVSGHQFQRSTVAALPATYLVVKAGEASAFRRQNTFYEMDGPFELRLVDGNTDRLVALWYRRHVRPPYWLPVLSFSGWMGNNTTYSDEIDRTAEKFIDDALGQTPLRQR